MELKLSCNQNYSSNKSSTTKSLQEWVFIGVSNFCVRKPGGFCVCLAPQHGRQNFREGTSRFHTLTPQTCELAELALLGLCYVMWHNWPQTGDHLGGPNLITSGLKSRELLLLAWQWGRKRQETSERFAAWEGLFMPLVAEDGRGHIKGTESQQGRRDLGPTIVRNWILWKA